MLILLYDKVEVMNPLSRFINDLMQDIWKNESVRFKKLYEYYMNMPEKQITALLESNKALVYENDGNNMTSLITCGCQHFYSNFSIAGCSMCNLHRKSVETAAALTALRDRNRCKYSEMVCKSFTNARGVVQSRTIHEYLFSYDFLNPMEIPDECLEMLLFGEGGVFSRKPWIYEFETTARSISKVRLKLLKRYVGNRDIIIRIGVECADEFIRNEWLNKNLFNQQIIDAISLCHEEGIKITGNILLGIPGFTEELSINQFIDTVHWLFSCNMDYISCSLLSRTEKSFQGFLHSSLKNNDVLQKYGLAYMEHTGLPWLFSLVRAIHQLYNSEPETLKKIFFGQFIDSYIEQSHSPAFNQTRECSCVKEFNQILTLGKLPDDWRNIHFFADYKADPCYPYYMNLCERQNQISNVMDNMRILSKEVIDKKWGEGDRRLYDFNMNLKNHYFE
ncbi:MAG: hypothetical protein HFE65_08415 [Clostridiales bacterium]|nr:hypothetical protein [Clostridiales bacterium]